MLSQFKQCFYVAILLYGLGVSTFAYGSMEVTGYGGMNFDKTLELSQIAKDKADHEGRSWIFGGDVVYRLSAFSQNCGLGLRWQHSAMRGADYKPNQEGSTTQTLNVDANRVALLGGYRFVNSETGLFLGVIGALDIWRSMKIQADAGNEREGSVFDISGQQWPGTGQLGVEFGFKWASRFFIKGEAGYSYYKFNDLKYSNDDLKADGDPEINLSSIYATLGIGWFFI